MSHPIDEKTLAAIERKLGSHAVFAPSSSAMWMGCPGSLIPNLFADDTAGIDAATGTVAHGVAEMWLKTGVRPSHLIGTVEEVEEPQETFAVEIDEVMLDHVESYVGWCRDLGGEQFVETKVDFSDLTPIPNQRGTADHAAVLPGKLVVSDLKYGKGEMVFANSGEWGNTQGLLYAYGFFKKYDKKYKFQEIVIRIAQPRLNHFDERTVSRAGLLDFAEYARRRAHDAWRNDAPRRPDPKACRWCNVKATCAAYAVKMEHLVDSAFFDLAADITESDEVDLRARLASEDYMFNKRHPRSLTTSEMAALLPWRRAVEGWWADLQVELEQRCAAGEEVPGYKMVEARSIRVFNDERRASDHLSLLGLDDSTVFRRKLISPAQAEEALMKAGFPRKSLPGLLHPVVVKPPGKPTMVASTDKRPSVIEAVDSAFRDLDDDIF